MCLSIQLVKADIGETFTLKQQRTQILSEIRVLQSDFVSESISAILDSLHLRVLSLDEKIFVSYEESISRVANQIISRGSNDTLTIYVALVTTGIALFFALLLLMARSRVQSNKNLGLREMYKQLTMDFLGKVSAEKPPTQNLLRVNAVVLVGLVTMIGSIVAYVLSRL